MVSFWFILRWCQVCNLTDCDVEGRMWDMTWDSKDELGFEYKLIKSRRAKRVRIVVKPGGEVVVTVPWWTPKMAGEAFLRANSQWVRSRVARMEKIKPLKKIRHTKEQMALLKLKALELVEQRLEWFNKMYKYDFNKVSIRDQKTRWGSCSQNKNLNFNYRIALLPAELADYLVVHELCHLKEMNHSKRFWDLVGKSIPNYKILRKKLRNMPL